MSDSQGFTKPRVNKQFLLRFRTFVRIARKYALCQLPAADIVDELNILVSENGLDSFVSVCDAENPAQTVMFKDESKAAQ